MFVTIIAQHRCIVNKNAIVLLTVNQKYYGLKLLYEHLSYNQAFNAVGLPDWWR